MRFLVLDGWRGVCAMMVAFFHLAVIGHIIPGSMDSSALIHNSWLFVDFFFVLSGFIITHSLSHGLDNLRAFTAFAIRRFGRLWPTHLVMVGLILTYQFINKPPNTTFIVFDFKTYSLNDFLLSLAYYLTFTHSLPDFYVFGIKKFADINPPSWSISVEYWIYITFGAILLYGRRWKSPIMAVIIVVSGLLLLIIVQAIGTSFEYGLFRCAYGFFVGHFVYRLHGVSIFPLRHWYWMASVVEALTVVMAVAFVILTGPVLPSLLAPAVFGITVYVFAFEAGMVSSLMLTRPFHVLGTLSFTIYMGHTFVALAYADGLRLIYSWFGINYSIDREMYWENVTLISFPSMPTANLSALVYALLVVGFAALLSRWIEVPCRDRVNRFAKDYAAASDPRSVRRSVWVVVDREADACQHRTQPSNPVR